MSIGFPELFLVFILVANIIWIWMLVDCAKHESSTGNGKVVWILIIIFTHWIGALIYYVARRGPRRAAMAR
jgi:hypothetical protein